jgi:hypothetical protein
VSVTDSPRTTTASRARTSSVVTGWAGRPSLSMTALRSDSARRGPYRILYNVNDTANRVEIQRIDHQADVYRNG